MDKDNNIIEIEDCNAFVWGVDPTVGNLQLQYVRERPKESASQSGGPMAGSYCQPRMQAGEPVPADPELPELPEA